MFEKYQDVKPTQPICSFIDVNKIKIEISVPQQLAVKTKKDDLVNIVFDVLPDDIFVATVEEVSKSPSKNNLSFKLTAIIPNSDSSLIAGMSGKMLINNPDNNNIVAVPQRVIRNNPREGSFVWVTDGSKCILKNVRTGKLLKDGMIEITSGLTSDDIIVSTGLELLTEGKSIEIINR